MAVLICDCVCVIFFFKQKTAYEMRISDWSSDVCSSDLDGSPESELEDQVRLAFNNLKAVLAAADCTFDDVVDVTVFIVDPESTFETIWKVVPEFWGSAPHPTLTAVGVTWLYGFQFEIKVIARLPETGQG